MTDTGPFAQQLPLLQPMPLFAQPLLAQPLLAQPLLAQQLELR